jgi:putative transposase
VEIISHGVWRYHRFPLSLRDVEEMMAERGVSVSYDTIHQWCRKFGQTSANGPALPPAPTRRQVASGRGLIKIAGQTHYLWRGIFANFPNTAARVAGYGRLADLLTAFNDESLNRR